jgi:hypothetical protein
LAIIHKEAAGRQYAFDSDKVNWKFKRRSLTVTKGQIKYETGHLLAKLKLRDPEKFRELKKMQFLEPHPLFKVIEGDIEEWEIII